MAVSLVISSCNGSTDDGTVSNDSSYFQNVKRDTLKIAHVPFFGVFNPFYVTDASDMDVMDLVFVSLLTFDRNGDLIADATNEKTISYNGKDHKYSGISDLKETIGVNGEVTYELSLKENVRFSDGEVLDADDVIFTLYVLCDKSYDGPNMFSSLPVYGIEDYQNNITKNISGIVKTGEFSLKIKLSHYDTTAISKMSVFVAPMHYYGDAENYDYKNSNFGFEKGNINSANIKTNMPLGAGSYEFKNYSNGVVYLERNTNYFKGSPLINKIEFLEFDEETLISKVINGNCDICEPLVDESVINMINNANGGSMDGDVITTFSSVHNGYGYIGINADVVNVGGNPSSKESKYLRKAFATLFSAYRAEALKNFYGDYAKVLEYPISKLSWLYPDVNSENYQTAYAVDINNHPIYLDDNIDIAVALIAAIDYFKAAGFVYDESSGKFTQAPNGASVSYEVLVPGQGNKEHPAHEIFEKAKEALNNIGIDLVIKDLNDTDFWDAIDCGDAAIWAAIWHDTSESNFRYIYHSKGIGYYGINDGNLDKLIDVAAISSDVNYKKDIYYDCFEIIFDWAVEIPFYQRLGLIAVNSYNVDLSNINGDYTDYYSWINDIYLIDLY